MHLAARTALLAGKAIAEVVASGQLGVSLKADASPLTIADKAANAIIMAQLGKCKEVIPVLSEEEKEIPFSKRADWERVWVVDPLDGTRGFIHGEPHYVVSIGLVECGRPVIGALYAPALDMLWYGAKGKGAWKLSPGETQPRRLPIKTPVVGTGLISRRNAEETDIVLLHKIGLTKLVNMSSAIKFARLAEGRAQGLVRSGPTYEWDSAGGEAILNAVGGGMLSLENFSPLAYNKPNLLNPGYVAWGPGVNLPLQVLQ
jgi:3'(2'), 5'-bisphosphate nucleotidase